MKHRPLIVNGLLTMALALPAMALGGDNRPILRQISLHEGMECPSKDDLNATTLNWHFKSEGRAFLGRQYTDEREAAELRGQYGEADLVELSTASHASICESLNRRFSDNWNVSRWDREMNRWAPEMYSIYYQIGDRFVVLTRAYSAGDPSLDAIGAPSGGATGVHVFDKDLNEVGSFSF